MAPKIAATRLKLKATRSQLRPPITSKTKAMACIAFILLIDLNLMKFIVLSTYT